MLYLSWKVKIMNYVQAYISNISFPTSLEEVYSNAHLFNMEMILGCDYYNLLDENNYMDFDDEEKFNSRATEWTAPKWCKKGDIVFFMHAKMARSKITALKTELMQNRNVYSNNQFWIMMNALIRSKRMHEMYGGKIFAVGRVMGMPKTLPTNQTQHWKSNIYAPIDSVFLLEKPIDISEFDAEVMVSRQSSITPVFGEQFEFLKQLIIKKNKLREAYLDEAVAEPIPLTKTNDENWLDVVNKYRRSFFLEIQFRAYYVDRFLKVLGDNKSFFKECACKKGNNPTTYVDNVIKFNGKYLPIEIKLAVPTESNIIRQLNTYCNVDSICLEKNRIITDNYYNNVLVIDTDDVYLFSPKGNKLNKIYSLNTIKSINDIAELRNRIIKLL